MPTTINGIGTHYYGKKDRDVRMAACGSCHRVGPLESYETRLWFVIVFIPVIPLGRKRVIDRCSYCSRHSVADAHAFETARQLQTSEALERYRRLPSTEGALEAHARMLAFREHDRAAELRRDALERFPEHAELRAALAGHLVQVGAFDLSAAFFDEAMELQPELPEARVGVALRKMDHGELDEARRLLDFLEEPGAAQRYELGPLDTLSSLYQRQGRHDEALDLAGTILRELPEAGQHGEFRAFVRKSERALLRDDSILPPLRHSLGGLFRKQGSAYPAWQRRSVVGGLALGIVAVGLLLNNEYIRRHRTLHVVNATGAGVNVIVDDGAATTLGPGLGRLTLAEGVHQIRLSGAVEEQVEVALQSGFLDRWFRSPFWVLNPGGEAVLREGTLHYAEDPRPSEEHLIVGRSFIALPDVDYPFETPPESLEVSSGDSEVVKTAVSWSQTEDEEAVYTLAAEDRGAALEFAERRLLRDPGREGLLESYVQTAGVEQMPRVEAFLQRGLDRRPVSIPWHRFYQVAAEVDGQTPDTLIAQYDQRLADHPEDAALLYLRGRIETDPDRDSAFYEQAIAADPELAWPRFALGVRAEASANWDEAMAQLSRAAELGMKAEHLDEPIHICRLALGEAEAMGDEYRNRLARNPLDLDAVLFLADALAASGQQETIASEVASWESRIPFEVREAIAAPIQALTRYQAGDLEAAEAIVQSTPMLRSSPFRLETLLGRGPLPEEIEQEPSELAGKDPWVALAVSLGLSLEGRSEESERWHEAACSTFETLGSEARAVANALRGESPPTSEELRHLTVEPQQKALLLAVLAERFEGRRADYQAEAERFNLRRIPPFHLIRRAIDDAPPES